MQKSSAEQFWHTLPYTVYRDDLLDELES